jgi:hypothetical protein
MPLAVRSIGALVETTMIRRVALGALAIFGLTVSAATKAQSYSGEATLVTAVPGPSEFVIDGITWQCEDTQCVGRSKRARKESQLRECIKLVVAVGPVAAFRSRGRTMSADTLAECNRSSR